MMKNPDERFLVTNKPLKIGHNVEEPVDTTYATMSEMPQFSDKDKELADHESFEPPMYAKLKKSYPIALPGGIKGAIDLYQFDANPASKEILLKLDTGEGVAVMQFDAPEESDLPFPTVLFAGVKESHRGKGLSKSLYDFIIKMYKGVISDATLTGEEGYGSFHTWQSLAKSYNAYIVGVNDVVTPRNGFTKDAMGSHHERFMATQYPFDYAKHNQKRQMAYTEVELMQHKAENDIDSSDPNEWDFVSGQKLIEKKVGNGIIFLKMKIAHANDVKYALKDVKTNKIISGMRAKIDPNDYKVDPNEAQISSVVTGEQYRNKGWGKLLYKLVLDAEKTIVSDYQIYPGAAAIWSKYLPTIANVYNYNEDGELEPFDFAKGTSKQGIYDYFVASKKKLL
jgi:GNAT superfamily N-acetyltransferase/ribosomal protein S18 acetylase RimI-like enzyme